MASTLSHPMNTMHNHDRYAIILFGHHESFHVNILCSIGAGLVKITKPIGITANMLGSG